MLREPRASRARAAGEARPGSARDPSNAATCFAARRERGAIRSQRASLRKLTRKAFKHKRLLGFLLGAAPPRRPPGPFRYSSYWMAARSAVIGVRYSSTAARWSGWSR
ncbi:hypothetical protein GCM10010187_64620 [Actinomadura coerulea]|nr:hypothetical protein GCM10010187_64620 [Actinomadura coerulea]